MLIPVWWTNLAHLVRLQLFSLYGATEPDSRSRSRHYLRHLLMRYCILWSPSNASILTAGGGESPIRTMGTEQIKKGLYW